MSEKISCRHYYQGPLAETLQQAIDSGVVTTNGIFGGVCDWRVPIQNSELPGKDVSCVGPNDPRCPEPQVATVEVV